MFEIKDVMTSDIVTVTRQTPIMEVIELLLEKNVTGMPVINDDGSMAGIISEKDVLVLLSDLDNSSAVVEDFMTEDVTSFDVNDDLIGVCECLVQNHFRRVPIVDDGRLIGIVSRRDIIKYILEPIA